MKINIGFQSSCSECSIILYTQKLDTVQKEFLNTFLKTHKLEWIWTPMHNVSIEDEKEAIWAIKDNLEACAKMMQVNLVENEHYRVMRDDSYYDSIEDKTI